MSVVCFNADSLFVGSIRIIESHALSACNVWLLSSFMSTTWGRTAWQHAYNYYLLSYVLLRKFHLLTNEHDIYFHFLDGFLFPILDYFFFFSVWCRWILVLCASIFLLHLFLATIFLLHHVQVILAVVLTLLCWVS